MATTIYDRDRHPMHESAKALDAAFARRVEEEQLRRAAERGRRRREARARVERVVDAARREGE